MHLTDPHTRRIPCKNGSILFPINMKFLYTNLETCREATGMVIVIDVIRAFTNAACAFSRGVKEIYPVSTVEEALHFKTTDPGLLICGGVGGAPPDGFDFGNPPTQSSRLDLGGKTVVQRPGAGTQGIVRTGGEKRCSRPALWLSVRPSGPFKSFRLKL